MGYASEEMIGEFRFRYETDADFRRNYDEAMQIDAALEAAYIAQEIEDEKFEDWFDDNPVDHTGRDIELPPRPVIEIDPDIPF